MNRILILFGLILIIVLILILFISNNKSSLYGKYVVDEIIYASPLISVTKDEFENEMKNTKILITHDFFKIESQTNKFEVKNPIYKKEQIENDILNVFSESILNTIKLHKINFKSRYTILNAENEKVNYYLYLSEQGVWLILHTKAGVITVIKINKSE